MGSWRDAILQEFTPQVSRLTLVADPDELLLEEGILRGIEERGFELIPFDDHVAFRYAYESRYRARWDCGELTELVVVLRANATNLRSLPFDLLQAGRRLAFDLGDLFPNLSYPVVAALDRADLEALFDAQTQYSPGRLGDNATKDFVLLHVFSVAPELMKQPSDLLRFLLRRHHQALRIPSLLDDRLVDVLFQNKQFSGWPLKQIVSDREAFFAFLQERWPIFLDRLVAGEAAVRKDTATYHLEFPGPEDLAFEHDDVRVLVDNLFLEGMLEPVSHPEASKLSGSWAAVGVCNDPVGDMRRRWDGLIASIREALPSANAHHQDWQAFAARWGQLIVLHKRLDGELSERDHERFGALQSQVDDDFVTWILSHYGTLCNQPAVPPVMVHHIPRQLARMLNDNQNAKVALLVMDGLSLDQWIVAHEVLRGQRPGLQMSEESVFAWIPSITSVSRQACFAGRPPLYFPMSIHSTGKEPNHWRRFWEDEGLAPAQIGYEKSISDAPDLKRVERLISHPKIRAVGLVADKVDKIMHGMELGTAGMHNQVRQWIQQGVLASLLDMLLNSGFTVFLTADHGNIEGLGCGRPNENSLADMRGERARIFKTDSLRTRVHEQYPDAIAWPPIGLPDDYLALFPRHRGAFVKKDDKVVCHGGITVEEVIVPLVQFHQR